MPLSSTTVGVTAEPMTHDIDARWTMAYAAGLGDTLPCYFDTTRPEGVVAHPLFPVCFEWPLVIALRRPPGDELLTPEERLRSVHTTHDLVIHRLVRPGDCLTTRLTIAGVERRRPGAYQVMRLDTVDTAGAPVCATWMGALFRGVDVDGPDRPADDVPPLTGATVAADTVRHECRLPIAGTAAHVYTECARIWNPIHTDVAVAAQAGLPGIILHGTATLALAVSRVVALEADEQPQRVRRIAARFGAMVPLPSEIVLRILSRTATAVGDIVAFEVRTAGGELAVRDGRVCLV